MFVLRECRDILDQSITALELRRPSFWQPFGATGVQRKEEQSRKTPLLVKRSH